MKHRLQIDIIKRLIDLRPVLLNEEDVNGLTPLARLILFDESGHNPDKKVHARGDFATLVKIMCEGGTKTCAGKARSKGAKELPLHLAASCQVHPSVLADIIEAFPEESTSCAGTGTPPCSTASAPWKLTLRRNTRSKTSIP